MRLRLTRYAFAHIHHCMTPADALSECVKRAGGQVALADRIKVSQASVSRWMRGLGTLPGEKVLLCEQLYEVSRHVLRPDLYPVDAPAAPPAWRGVDRGGERVSFNRQGKMQGRAA